jgi:hypothetical protein
MHIAEDKVMRETQKNTITHIPSKISLLLLCSCVVVSFCIFHKQL